MTLADLSIKRPTFISCIVVLMLAVGWVSMRGLGVDLFPDVTFPVVLVSTAYRGAGPAEVETLVSKPLEDEIGTLSGLKRLTSQNQEGLSTVVAEFTLETDVKAAEQEIRDRVSAARARLPRDIEEPVFRRVDPSDQPVLQLALHADLKPSELYDLADDVIRPKLEQVPQVGLVEIWGGRKREIRVELDRHKLRSFELSAVGVSQKLADSGENIPAGKVDEGRQETVFRTMGEFSRIGDLQGTILSFFGNERPVRVSDVGHVVDTLEDERSRTFVDGKQAMELAAYRQSGSNTIAVVDSLLKRVGAINQELGNRPGHPALEVVRDGSKAIRDNVEDVRDTIYSGIVLAVVVVFFFLANGRSTIITGLALPNSLIGAFILMAAFGFTINMMTLLALSLAVGLLVDDAIVVRENIFRHIEMGEEPKRAASIGTREVSLAVIATTMTVIAVFGPVAFLKGMVGQFFKQFGLTICFAMAISLFDALTIAPMLSAYFAGGLNDRTAPTLWNRTIGRVLRYFDRFQGWLEGRYERFLRFTLRHPAKVLGASFLIFILSFLALRLVPQTFLPPQDNGEFDVALQLPPGTNLEEMTRVAKEVDTIVRSNPEVQLTSLLVGNSDGEPNIADSYVHLVPSKNRRANTTQVKERIREQLKPYAYASPQVKDYDPVGAGQRPFMLRILGPSDANGEEQLERIATKAYERLRKNPGLVDIDLGYKPGKPELQVAPDKARLGVLGFSVARIGQELRAQVEGLVPAKFRQSGRDYDIRVRLQDDQRDLRKTFGETYVPNLNDRLIRLSDIAKPVVTTGPAKIFRQNRGRYIEISADLAAKAGLGDIMKEVQTMFADDLKLPPGMSYSFIGQAEDFAELQGSMATAFGLGALFIFLVLASLYESFVTPLTIMLALPLALCGTFVALAVTRQSFNIFAVIGVIMLMGVATKNSILLVDYARQKLREGKDRAQAVIEAGRTRLRPILMTTMALIAGTLPVALGLNEASRQRVSMGIAIIGGLISSTLLTLIVVPAAFIYIDRYRVWSGGIMKRIFMPRSRARHDLRPDHGSCGKSLERKQAGQEETDSPLQVH